MKDNRPQIAAEYSAAVQPDQEKQSIVARTGAAGFADYSATDLQHVSAEAVEASFGCGNPLAFSGVQSGQTVLDLGCGAGLDLLIAAAKVGPQGTVIGVDMTDAMLEKAQKNITAAGLLNVQLRKGYVETLPIESNSIDWVISNCVINLSAEKEKVFAEIARVLKPGGQMLVSDIVAENLPWWVRRSGVLTAACAGSAISEAAYLEGLRAAGLTECAVLARQHYEPVQMAALVVDGLPSYLQNLSCCGKPLVRSMLTKMAQPIAEKLWSARLFARKPLVH